MKRFTLLLSLVSSLGLLAGAPSAQRALDDDSTLVFTQQEGGRAQGESRGGQQGRQPQDERKRDKDARKQEKDAGKRGQGAGKDDKNKGSGQELKRFRTIYDRELDKAAAEYERDLAQAQKEARLAGDLQAYAQKERELTAVYDNKVKSIEATYKRKVAGVSRSGNPWADYTDADGLVEVCHVPPGNSRARKTIRVSPSAVQAHLDHGDLLGGCDGDPQPAQRRGKADDGVEVGGAERRRAGGAQGAGGTEGTGGERTGERSGESGGVEQRTGGARGGDNQRGGDTGQGSGEQQRQGKGDASKPAPPSADELKLLGRYDAEVKKHQETLRLYEANLEKFVKSGATDFADHVRGQIQTEKKRHQTAIEAMSKEVGEDRFAVLIKGRKAQKK